MIDPSALRPCQRFAERRHHRRQLLSVRARDELLARVVLEAGDKEVAHDIFSSYDEFLDVLANREARAKLEAVPFEEALDDSTYAGLHDASQRFRRGITRLFFDVHPRLPMLIRDFGVF